VAKSTMKNGMNCWKAKFPMEYANQQPSRMNGMKVMRKVQRLEIEEPTNNISLASRTLRGDDIVQTL